MNRPRVLAVLALVAAFAGAALTVVWLAADERPQPARTSTLSIRDPLAEALRHVPRNAPVVAVLATDAGRGPLRAGLDLLGRLPGSAEITRQLDALLSARAGLPPGAELAALAGSPLVLAATGTAAGAPLLGAWVVSDADALRSILADRVQDGRLQDAGRHRGATLFAGPARAGVYAQRDRLLLAASDRRTLRTALNRGAQRGTTTATGLTKAGFTTRAASGVSAAAALVRVGVSGPALRRLIADRVPRATQLPWVAALDGAGIGVEADDAGLHLRTRLRTDETMLSGTDLPLATGTAAPAPTGEADVRLAVRDPARTIDFALGALRSLAPERVRAYDELKALLARYTQVDVERDILATLTGDATFSLPGLAAVTLRAQTADEDGVRSALQRLARVGRLAGLAGALGLGVDTGGIAIRDDGDDTYTISRDEDPVGVIGLRGDVLVLSSDPGTDVDEVADAFEQAPDEPGVRGALVAASTAAAFGELLVDRLGLPALVRVPLTPLGDPLVTARAELRGMTIGVDLPLDG